MKLHAAMIIIILIIDQILDGKEKDEEPNDQSKDKEDEKPSKSQEEFIDETVKKRKCTINLVQESICFIKVLTYLFSSSKQGWQTHGGYSGCLLPHTHRWLSHFG